MPIVGRVPILIFLVCAALAIAGCGSSDDSSSTTSGSSNAANSKSTTDATGAESANGDSDESGQDAGNSGKDSTSEEQEITLSRPGIPRVKGPPPQQLIIKDWLPGTGAVAKEGDEVTVQYVGVDYKTGTEFDASWDREEPFTFTLGGEEVIPGWDKGIVGMKENGRRELIIPPDLAYGAEGSPPKIKPNETLIFMIDLVSVG